jgi:glycosyltransferase 2 family protein
MLILSPKVSPAAIFGSLLAYRAIYYFLPLLVAAGLLGLYELKYGRKKINNKM